MLKDLIIRPAQPGDAMDIAQVNFETWKTTYTGILEQPLVESYSLEDQEKLWKSLLNVRSVSQQRFVAQYRNRVVAYCGGGRNPDIHSDYAAQLYGVYVLKRYQLEGVGRQLLTALAAWLSSNDHASMLAWVYEKNPHRFFCEKMGAELLKDHMEVDYNGSSLQTVCYGWKNLESLMLL